MNSSQCRKGFIIKSVSLKSGVRIWTGLYSFRIQTSDEVL
jgi:hypothetical protein